MLNCKCTHDLVISYINRETEMHSNLFGFFFTGVVIL